MQEMQERQVWFLVWEDPLEKGMASHSSILAWSIPWKEEPLQIDFQVINSRNRGCQGLSLIQKFHLMEVWKNINFKWNSFCFLISMYFSHDISIKEAYIKTRSSKIFIFKNHGFSNLAVHYNHLWRCIKMSVSGPHSLDS